MGRKSKANIRKQEILAHFYEVIIDEGFEGASIAKIAKRMDVNPSLLIHYFSTKDAMVLGLIDYIIDTYSVQIIPDFSGTTDPAERWDDVLDVVSRIQWDRIMNNTVYYSCYTLSFRYEEIRQRFRSFYKGLVNTLAYEVEHANRAGIIQVEDSTEVAEMMLSLVEGANFYQHVGDRAISLDARAERIKTIMKSVFALPQA